MAKDKKSMGLCGIICFVVVLVIVLYFIIGGLEMMGLA